MKVSLKDFQVVIEFESQKANSFSRQMLTDLAQAVVANHNQAKVILIKSSGEKAFSAGASFEEFKAIVSKEQAENYFSGFMEVLEAIRISTCPVICRVQGKAVGGAVGVISACDYVFAHSSAEVKLSELELGIGPFTISPALERKLGLAKFSEMIFDGNWKSPTWSAEIGLFNQVFDSLVELDKHLDIFIAKLSQQSKEALSANRKLLWQGTENWPSLMKEKIKIVSDLMLNSKK